MQASDSPEKDIESQERPALLEEKVATQNPIASSKDYVAELPDFFSCNATTANDTLTNATFTVHSLPHEQLGPTTQESAIQTERLQAAVTALPQTWVATEKVSLPI